MTLDHLTLDPISGRPITRREVLRRLALGGVGGFAATMLPGCREPAPPPAPPVAQTRHGLVRGTFTDGVFSFKGIRYGAPTGGANRFMPPQPPSPWAGTAPAVAFGSSAPQSNPASSPSTSDYYRTGEESEDCLFLNVWTAGLGDDGALRPVLFWLHGGGFTSLSASAPLWDGTSLASRGDVVVVSVNHRLGALGYTHLGDIGGEEYAHAGNVGMLDVIQALDWVRGDIHRFGGDPDRVMIFGESGGGQKVSMLLGSPTAAGLFHRAIIESGPGVKMIERDHGTMMAELLLDELGLTPSRLSEIHDMPLERIMAAQFAATARLEGRSIPGILRGFAPVLDPDILPAHPFYPTASPVSADVPVIVGYNHTESTFFFRSDDSVWGLSEADMRGRVAAWLGSESDADMVIAAYRRAHPDASTDDLHILITTDYPTAQYSIEIAERKAALGRAPAYLYRFDWETPTDPRLKSPHGLEVPFVFDNIETAPGSSGGGPEAIRLAERMSAAWVAFATTGDPNTRESGLPEWRPYEAERRATMLFNDDSDVVDDPVREERIAMERVLNPG